MRDDKAPMPAHDPFQRVLNAMASLVRLIEDAAALADRPLLTADAERKLVERVAQDALQRSTRPPMTPRRVSAVP